MPLDGVSQPSSAHMTIAYWYSTMYQLDYYIQHSLAQNDLHIRLPEAEWFRTTGSRLPNSSDYI